MKKIIQFSFYLTILVLIFSSCSQKGNLIKRHYTKGYYFQRSEGKPDLATRKGPDSKVQALKRNPVYVKSNERAELKESAKDLTAENSIKKESKKENNRVAIGKKYNETKPIQFSNPKKQMDLLSDAIKIGTADDVAREALSLLWILIVALLIVYIVGLLFDSFGLGWPFHILGVIVLVLLILWLLRII